MQDDPCDSKLGLTVLLAEDDEDDYALLAECFKVINHKADIRWVVNGEEALDYIFRKNAFEDPNDSPTPDLIFLDINMPIRDGFEVCSAIKSHEELKKIPTIMVTTSDTSRDIEMAYKVGANNYLKKPIGKNQIKVFKDALCHFWSKLVMIPSHKDPQNN